MNRGFGEVDEKFRNIKQGDYVRMLVGPRKGMIGEVDERSIIGIRVMGFFVYEGEVEYVAPEEAFLYKLENA